MPTSEGLHENEGLLAPAAIDRHRALASIGEELEAVDWYDQRVEATQNSELAEVLAHNRDEEKEHAAMALEWLRRNDPVFDRHLRTYLFTDGSIVATEHAGEDAAEGSEREASRRDADGSLGIGSLKEVGS
jgi:ferritin-like protein